MPFVADLRAHSLRRAAMAGEKVGRRSWIAEEAEEKEERRERMDLL